MRFDNLKRNVIVSGELGSGKTLDVLFPMVSDMIDRKESLFILDAKEEYLKHFYDRLSDYNVLILNLKDTDLSLSWNPLSYPYEVYKNDKDAAYDLIEDMCKNIYYDKSNDDPFWNNMASSFISGLVASLFTFGKEDEINFNSINALLSHDGKLLKNFVMAKFSSNSYVSTMTMPTISSPSATRASILSVAREPFCLLVSRERLSMLLSNSSFSYKDIVSKPTAIFFISKEDDVRVNSLISIFIRQLYMFMSKDSLERRFNFVLDNFDVLEKLSGFSSMLSFGISKNIYFYVGTRNLKKLINLYGSGICQLSDDIEVRKNSYYTVIDGVSCSFDKKNVKYEISSCKVIYPKLKETAVSTFEIDRVLLSDEKFKEIVNKVLNEEK